MYYRRKILLNLIFSFGENGIEKLMLQKILFLFCENQLVPVYSFIPYKYGCFSFEANKDLSILINHYGLIEERGNKWFIKENPPNLDLYEKSLIDSLINKFKSYDNNKLIAYICNKFAYYSIYSKWGMTDGQFSLVKKEKNFIENKNYRAFFSIGYEKKSIDYYLNELIKNNIKSLCDVRRNPLSMKYGFSKKQLIDYCKYLGIYYIHIPELGISSYKRKKFKDNKNYKLLFSDYKKNLLGKELLFEKILKLLNKYNRVALTCFESNYTKCHRHCISDYLYKNYKLECLHL